MKLFRVFPLDARATAEASGGVLFWPRSQQGAGRHDNPDRYACMYVSERPESAVAEALSPFRGTGELAPAMLQRAGLPLALARLELSTAAELVDLDEPTQLSAHALRPSVVATRDRLVTQGQALRLFDFVTGAVGLRWWSTLESSWINTTLFDRASGQLTVEDVLTLGVADDRVREAAYLLGLV